MNQATLSIFSITVLRGEKIYWLYFFFLSYVLFIRYMFSRAPNINDIRVKELTLISRKPLLDLVDDWIESYGLGV